MRWTIPFLGREIVFGYPERAWLAFIIVFLAAFAGWEALRRRKAWRNPWLRLHYSTARLPGAIKRICWWAWFSLGMLFLVLIAMSPQEKFIDKEPVYGEIRITLMVDTSLSMFFAGDVKPNRMAAAKELLKRFIMMLRYDPELKGRYSIALIPFAETANPVFAPFTTSYENVLSNIANLGERTVTKQGTSVWAALKAYDDLILWYSPRKGQEGGVTTLDLGFLISDGGKEEGRVEERLHIPQLMRELRDPYRTQEIRGNNMYISRGLDRVRSVVVNTVGIGAVKSENGGSRKTVSVPLVLRDREGNFRCYYREDEEDPLLYKCKGKGRILTSALDEEILKTIAEVYGGGKYYHFFENQEQLLQEFKKTILEHRRIVGQVELPPRYEPALHWFAVPAFVIFYFLFGYGGWIAKLWSYMFLLTRRFLLYIT